MINIISNTTISSTCKSQLVYWITPKKKVYLYINNQKRGYFLMLFIKWKLKVLSNMMDLPRARKHVNPNWDIWSIVWGWIFPLISAHRHSIFSFNKLRMYRSYIKATSIPVPMLHFYAAKSGNNKSLNVNI